MAEEGHKIPVTVEFSTTGAEAAKRAVQDVSGAGAPGGSLADELGMTRERESAARVYAQQLAETDRIEEEHTARRKDRMDKVAKGLAAGGIAGAAAMAAQTIGQVVSALDTIDVDNLRSIDASMADQVETAKMWANGLKDPIGLLLQLTTGETVASAFAGMNEQLALTAKQHEEHIDRLISSGIKQRDELRKLTAEIKAANDILDARDDADAKARDREDAAAIRGGANPEQVRAKRAEYDAKKEIDRINRNLDPQIAATQAAFENVGEAKKNLGMVERDPNAKREHIDDARKQVADMEAEFKRQQEATANAKAIAAERRRGVREGTAGTVEDLTGRQESSAKKTASALGKELAEGAGADAAKLAELQQEFKLATQGMGDAVVQTIAEVVKTQMDHEKRMKVMQAQIRNQRTGK